MSNTKILYCGDADKEDAARYLLGILMQNKFSHKYVPSEKKLTDTILKTKYDLYILSDYPSSRMTKAQLALIAKRVEEGASLWMIGGWGSFRGVDGMYQESPLEEVLPVVCSNKDDRMQGHVLYRIDRDVDGSKLFKKYDFHATPSLAGYNRVQAKDGVKKVLSIKTYGIDPRTHRQFQESNDPLLVLGSYGKGKVAAWTSDIAPHWIGGLVDWGRKRVKTQITKKVSTEVGIYYHNFFTDLIQLLTRS